VESIGLATFPDASVICGARPARSEPEVDRAQYDTGKKLDAYRTIPSLRACVIVSHRERRVTVHRRGADGTWATISAGRGGRLALETLPAELIVDIYRGCAIA
jgi:Uma2 family endonuclease